MKINTDQQQLQSGTPSHIMPRVHGVHLDADPGAVPSGVLVGAAPPEAGVGSVPAVGL